MFLVSLSRTFRRVKKRIAVEYVDQTTAWKRPTGFPSASTKEVFSDVVDKNSDSFKPETVKVAMKESQHQSDKDKRMHYTAYELDKDGNVIGTSHIVDEKIVWRYFRAEYGLILLVDESLVEGPVTRSSRYTV
ncbi:hypothetical protein N7G274_001113 [Stereocaulon virgatum]|uniref:Uncharacterized protein n=1 Tax=Stereocaulon virgatum TaxID=373712 RepID=A0ABR4ANH2_9LECA